MPDGPDVREATTDDVDRIVDLWVALAADQRRHGSHLPAERNRAVAREQLARRVVAGGVRVADDGNGLVGFVTFEVETGWYVLDADRGVVEDLFVTPDARDSGVGGRLLDAAEAALRDAGVEAVTLEAMADNDAARKFYERRGYRPHRVAFEKGLESDTRRG